MINQFINIHSGKRCFIIGNGPSIKKQNLFSLKNEITFCSNWFLNHQSFNELNINYYCSYVEGFVIPSPNQQWINKLAQVKINKFFPKSWEKYNLVFEDTNYVNYDKNFKIYEQKHFNIDIDGKGLMNGDTVIINFCIPIAIIMGCKEIILLGCDTSYGIGNNNSLSNAYFYKPDYQFTPNVHNAVSEKQWQKNVIESYRLVKEYTDKENIGIYNATDGGSLEIFPRIELESVINI
jgi:hypothetical protein